MIKQLGQEDRVEEVQKGVEGIVLTSQTNKVKKTYSEMVARHKDFLEKYEGQKTVLDALKEEEEKVSKEIQGSIPKITRCLASLQQNALRPDSGSSSDYIEQMISAEEYEKKPGYRARIKALRLVACTINSLEIKAGGDVDSFLHKK